MKKKIILFLLLVLSVLSACSNDKNEVKDSSLYEGRNLTIAVAGKVPEIREQNIVFINVELKELNQESIQTKYDAVFIMKEDLS
ncbi:hypothetical protein [Metabacillus halosaccharovorans]|uniref:hypothetical protein n=1 Tax=Metabacillus halosaccharovorans TaxID=930124 RepID=UPI003735F7C2